MKTKLMIIAALIVINVGVCAPLLAQSTHSIEENFDVDPEWTRFNNPSGNSSFGFQDTNLAGGSPGEAGGFFSASSEPVWYGDEDIGGVPADAPLSASGIMNIISVDPDYNTNVFIGHFDSSAFGVSTVNGIGFQVLEDFSQMGTGTFRIFYLVGNFEGLLFEIDGLNVTRNWSYSYNPDSGDFGSLSVSISGPGGGTVIHVLSEVERLSIGSINTFGMGVTPQESLPVTGDSEIYFDNLVYSALAMEERYVPIPTLGSWGLVLLGFLLVFLVASRILHPTRVSF